MHRMRHAIHRESDPFTPAYSRGSGTRVAMHPAKHPTNHLASGARDAYDGHLAPVPDDRTPERLLADFRTNPGLVMHELISANNHAIAGDLIDTEAAYAVAAQLNHELGHPAVDGAAERSTITLPGPITVTRNRTSAATARTLDTRPTKRTLAALLAGEQLVHDILAIGMPDHLAGQHDVITRLLAPIARAHARLGLDRRGPMFAEASARYLLHYAQPAALNFTHQGQLRRWHADHAPEADAHVTAGENTDPTDPARLAADVADAVAMGRRAAVASLLHRPRITWTHPGGLEHGVLLDRFHHTPYAGVIERDTWVRAKVAEDLSRVHALLGPHRPDAALGVRVHTHVAPNVGVHFLPDYQHGPGSRPVIGTHHRIGDCDTCATRLNLPNLTAETGQEDRP